MILNQLHNLIKEAVENLYNARPSSEQIQIQETSAHFDGDYSFVVFPILKLSRKNPVQTCDEIGEYLKENFNGIESLETKNGYLNISLKSRVWLQMLTEAMPQKKIGFRKSNKAKNPVLVEFSSPNTNKPLHLGHIRNNLLGYSIAAILEANGENILRVNLVNDRGIHICKSMIGWEKLTDSLSPSEAGVKGDKLVGDAYVAFDKAYKAEIAELMDRGLEKEEAEAKSLLMEEAREYLRLWEANESKTRDLWRKLNSWVYNGFNATYERLGISFDKIYYESDTYLYGKDITLKGVDDGVLIKKDDGSVWADLTSEGLDEKLLLRADGTSVYMTQDLGTALQRDREFNPEKMYYVVGNEQDYHFTTLVKVLKKLGYPAHKKIHHISYGMVELPSGRMKSREGTVVDADDLLDEMQLTAKRVTAELGKWTDNELEKLTPLFEILGQGALKYYILKVDPKKNILFNPDESIDFDGNTGPYIQYTHARISSLLQKGEEVGNSGGEHIAGAGEEDFALEERKLLRTLFRWPQVVEEAASDLSPALIANYCYEVAKGFNQFYHKHQILNYHNCATIRRRLAIAEFTRRILFLGMGLLGIELPEKM